MSKSGFAIARESRKVRKQGVSAVNALQRRRLASMVSHARAESALYRELYAELPDNIDESQQIPIINKKMMMDRFDEWCTDPNITLAKAQDFIADPARAGASFLGRYLLSTTSGTSGTRGIFVLDQQSQAVSMALGIIRASNWYNLNDRLRILFRGGRQAFVMATGGHFVGFSGAMQLMRKSWLLRKTMKIFSVHDPLPDLVSKLNHYDPAVLLGYASVISMLADEKEAGRLRIDPVLVQPAGESLKANEYERIKKAFDCKIGNAYAATECPFIASSCEHGWMHVDSDWVLLEPVEADYTPTPAGQTSHTVLVSNLANLVQPVLRYDLGDSVLMRADPCPCGNELPAIRVQGRSGDIVPLISDNGQQVSIAPLAFSTLFDRIAGIERFQIIQTEPAALRIRLHIGSRAQKEEIWPIVEAEMKRMLAENNLQNVAIERGSEPPEQSAGGKYRNVIPLQ